MMSKKVNHRLVNPLGIIDIEVDRNAYGRQVYSFVDKLPDVHFKRIQLIRQLSEPEIHSGAGHGGQAKGVGALPFTSKMINIHDHWDEEATRSPTPTDQNSDDSTSYIYGDEDAEHHQLPDYGITFNRTASTESNGFHNYMQKPIPISVVNEDSHELDGFHPTTNNIELATPKCDDTDNVDDNNDNVDDGDNTENSPTNESNDNNDSQNEDNNDSTFRLQVG